SVMPARRDVRPGVDADHVLRVTDTRNFSADERTRLRLESTLDKTAPARGPFLPARVVRARHAPHSSAAHSKAERKRHSNREFSSRKAGLRRRNARNRKSARV